MVLGSFSVNVFVFVDPVPFGVGLAVLLLLVPVCEQLTLAWAGCEDFSCVSPIFSFWSTRVLSVESTFV